jgi:hypothetical protein
VGLANAEEVKVRSIQNKGRPRHRAARLVPYRAALIARCGAGATSAASGCEEFAIPDAHPRVDRRRPVAVRRLTRDRHRDNRSPNVSRSH